MPQFFRKSSADVTNPEDDELFRKLGTLAIQTGGMEALTDLASYYATGQFPEEIFEKLEDKSLATVQVVRIIALVGALATNVAYFKDKILGTMPEGARKEWESI